MLTRSLLADAASPLVTKCHKAVCQTECLSFRQIARFIARICNVGWSGLLLNCGSSLLWCKMYWLIFFSYQDDAISALWLLHGALSTDIVNFQSAHLVGSD